MRLPRAVPILTVAIGSQWGCYFLVDRDGIVGTAPPAEAGPADVVSTDAPPEKDLLAYWSFDESTNGVVQDSSGSGNHGAVGSDAVVPGGRRGQALGASMSVASLDGQSFPRVGTLSFWLKADFTGAEKTDGRQYFSNFDPSRSHIFVRVPNAVGPNDTLALQVACQAPGIPYPFAVDFRSPPNNTWMHVVVVWDSDAHRAAAYVDGERLHSSSLPESWSPSDQRVVFGRDLRGGLLDEARLYGRAMSAEEVMALP